jgi:hypothetical protein
MINFYQTWKDDKDSAPKRKRSKPSNTCKIYNKAVNGLRDHIKGVHGTDMWDRYVAAEEAVKQQNLEQFRALL